MAKKVITKTAPARPAPAKAVAKKVAAKSVAKKASAKSVAKKTSSKKVATKAAVPARQAAPLKQAGKPKSAGPAEAALPAWWTKFKDSYDANYAGHVSAFTSQGKVALELQKQITALKAEVSTLSKRVTSMEEERCGMPEAAASTATIPPPEEDGPTEAQLAQLQVDSLDAVTEETIAGYALAQCKTYIALLGYETPTGLRGVNLWREAAMSCHQAVHGTPTPEQAADEATPLAPEAGDVIEGPEGEQAQILENAYDDEHGVAGGEVIYIKAKNDPAWYRAQITEWLQDEEEVWYLHALLIDSESNPVTDEAGTPMDAALYIPGNVELAENAPVIVGREHYPEE